MTTLLLIIGLGLIVTGVALGWSWPAGAIVAGVAFVILAVLLEAGGSNAEAGS